MNNAQRHRGPDGQGVFEDPKAGVSLGHVRLAVLDLSDSSAQPMKSADGQHALVFNGEIYNFRELRKDLEAEGCCFRSSGDTEVLLQGLVRHGKRFVEKLDGMFAFAFWNQPQQQLLLVRDRLGVKPLYYTNVGDGTLLFASEMKALCAHPKMKREPDFQALQQHLAYGHASGLRTALRGVLRVPPGSLLIWRPGTDLKTDRYWDLPFGEDALVSSDATSKLQDLMVSAVEQQLVSDVPVGAFLSGGLDSSIISAIAKRSGILNCYTTTYTNEDNQLDQAAADLPFARFMAKELGACLKEITMTSDVASLWDKLVFHLDEPLADPAAIACFLISKLAKDDRTTVMLSGQGADELFAGYPRYWAMHSTRQLSRLPLSIRRLVASTSAAIPGALSGKPGAFLRRVRRVLTAAHYDPIERFLGYCSATPELSIRGILSPGFLDQVGDESALDECAASMRADGSPELMNRFMRRDLATYLPNHNLLYTDKMGMATGVETRVPFIDNQLVDFVVKLPVEMKLRKGTTKYLLREASRALIPDRVIDRRKAGFGAPYRSWLRGDLAEMWQDLTTPDAVARRGWFDADALSSIRKCSQSGKVDLYMLQWAVLTMEIWAKHFIDENPADNVSGGVLSSIGT